MPHDKKKEIAQLKKKLTPILEKMIGKLNYLASKYRPFDRSKA